MPTSRSLCYFIIYNYFVNAMYTFLTIPYTISTADTAVNTAFTASITILSSTVYPDIASKAIETGTNETIAPFTVIETLPEPVEL